MPTFGFLRIASLKVSPVIIINSEFSTAFIEAVRFTPRKYDISPIMVFGVLISPIIWLSTMTVMAPFFNINISDPLSPWLKIIDPALKKLYLTESSFFNVTCAIVYTPSLSL